MARSMVAAEAEKRKLKALIKDNGKLKVLRVLARLLLSGAGRAYDVGTSCAEYAADLSIQQLVTIALLVYVFGNKVKPLLKLGITRVLNMLLKLGAGQMQSLLLTARSSLTAISAAIVAKLVNIALKLAMRSNPTATAAQSVSSTSPLPTAAGSLLMMSNFRMSNAVLMTTQELEVTDGLKAALMDNGASSNTSCSKSLEGAISGTFKAEDAGEIGLGSDGASLTSNGSYLYALKRFGFNGSELVVRRLKHTPNLPMEYVFSEATENKKHGYGIYWEPGKRRILKSPSGQEIELFHSNSDLGWLKVSVVTNKDTILSMLKVQKARGANLTVLTGAPPPPPPPSSSGPSAVVSQWQSTVKPTESGGTAVQDVQAGQVRPEVPVLLPCEKDCCSLNLVPKFCSMCSAEAVVCEEPHCMRGPCCQPNESCARCHTPPLSMLNNMMAPSPITAEPSQLPLPTYISRKFSAPPEHTADKHLTPKLMPPCETVAECADKVAYFLVSMERVGSRHAQSRDETSACNAEPRVDELVKQMAAFLGESFSIAGPGLILEAFKAEATKCGHSARNMLEMRLDKCRSGRCSECREKFKCDDLYPCFVCGQSLCDTCHPEGCHNWCVAPSAWTRPLRESPRLVPFGRGRPLRDSTASSADVPGRTINLDATQFRRDMLNPMDPSLVRTVGMGQLKPPTGVDLLRRRHCTDGHPALSVTVKNLKAEGAFTKKLVTLKDVELFQKQGCGSCELTKMRRRPFTVKVNSEVALPTLGKVYTFDVLELRVPAEHTGATYFYLVVEKVSKFAMGGTMRGYSEVNVTSALNEIRARVRPTHGDIEIIRMDSHPSHRGKHVRDYMLEAQQHMQLSPPYVHEGVGDVENFFLHYVPSANALLAAAPDLGENHFAQAMRYVIDAKNHSVSAVLSNASDNSDPKSPAMVFYSLDTFMSSGLHAFGSAAKALVHGEARDSKFDDHAKPCVYVGPAINSDSRAHCAVWFKREYKDVDLGCIAVNESVVLERTHRDHISTQPYNQVAATHVVDLGAPTSIFDLSGMDYSESELPHYAPIVWVRSMEMPTIDFVLLLWHGESRPGDMTSWMLELSNKQIMPYPIDLVIGGQEHNLSRGAIKSAVLHMGESEHCQSSFLQCTCSWYSASRYEQPGPPVLFDLNHVDGIPDEDGELPLQVMQALNDAKFCADLFRLTSKNDKVCVLEYPASQSINSPFSAKGRELHSTIADTSIMVELISELGLATIYTEQGASGAASRKPTSLLCTQNAAHALRRTVGTLFVKPNTKFESILGANADGGYKTKAAERYSSKFAMQLSIAVLGSMNATKNVMLAKLDSTAEPATDDLHPVGSRVELYWFSDKAWYRGTVMNSRVRKGMVHGMSISRREIQVRYDADEALLWHAVCDYSVAAACLTTRTQRSSWSSRP